MHWVLPEREDEGGDGLASALGVSPVLARLLIRRGICDERSAARFLQPDLSHLHDPLLLPDMPAAVDRLAKAIESGEPIAVHGDYDVDGVCAAALLTRVLRVLKADVRGIVPHRAADGYDIRSDTVRRLHAEGIRLIVTVDCGVLAFEAAETARELGVDLIVTDHHEPNPEGRLPRAVAVVNPKRKDSRYPFQDLCGTAVAFKVALALVRKLEIPSTAIQTRYLDLVGLATTTDCMPLQDENRVFVCKGLEILRSTRKSGLAALIRSARLGRDRIDARALGYQLGPRINAVGRMEDAQLALDLLLSTDEAECAELAARLENANRARQEEQERTLAEAIRQAQHHAADRILVLSSARWLGGIVGIVASRLTECLYRPAVLIAVDPDGGAARGSCRSVEGFHILDALIACSEHLGHFGGHKAAAGFDIAPEAIPALREAMQAYAREHLPEELLQPTVRVDAELPVEALTMRLAEELARMEPYGQGNPEPVFVSQSMGVLQKSRIAAKASNGKDHLKLRLEHPRFRAGIEAVFWRNWCRAEQTGQSGRIDACYTLECNRHNGYQNLQLNLKDFRPAREAGQSAAADSGTERPRCG